MKTTLHKDLGTFGWHSSLMTTYSVDAAFYDKYIIKSLRRVGCDNNLLLADAAMLTLALEATPNAFELAGRRYAIVPVSKPGCFHPKLHLRLGRHKARLIVGSANVTAAGWCRNLEVLAAIDWKPGSNQELGGLIKKAYEYITHWLPADLGETLRYKCRMHLQESSWLADLEAITKPVTLPDRTAIDMLCERGGGTPSIRDQFAELVGARVRNLLLISPYWDRSLRGLRDLRQSFGNCETSIMLDPARNEFPVGSLTKHEKDVEFFRLDAEGKERFPHAKIFLAETAKADHVLFGSANCSDDALGHATGRARNAEVCVYRRLPAGSVRGLLGLKLGKKIARTKITPPSRPSSDSSETSSTFHPGFMELISGKLRWYPAPGIDVTAACILLGEQQLAVTAAEGMATATLSGAPPPVLIARVRLASGRLSAPVIVHEEDALRRATPAHIDRRVRDWLENARDGFADLLDLAPHVHVLFAQETPVRTGTAQGGARRGAKSTNDREVTNYATAAAFRRAVTLKPANGRALRASTGDPGLLQILAIIQRGFSAIAANATEDLEDDDRGLLAGEREDGEEKKNAMPIVEVEDADDDSRDDEERRAAADGRVYTQTQFERRREHLQKALEGYYAALEVLLDTPSLISANVATHAALMIQLLMCGCTCEHRRVDLPPSKLLVMFPHDQRERDISLAYWVVRVLEAIWVGKDRDAIADHVHVGAHYTSLPDDLFEWVVASHWAIAHACLAVAGSSGILARKLIATARAVYVATRKLGPVDLESERARLRELDARFGFLPAITEELLRFHEQFYAKTGSSPAAD